MNQYVAWQDEESKVAYFNPIGVTAVVVGDRINGYIAVATGTLEEMTAKVHTLNATLPDVPSFGDMLNG